eukprot:5691571-Ditylum_brightwellii.AAC.1
MMLLVMAMMIARWKKNCSFWYSAAMISEELIMATMTALIPSKEDDGKSHDSYSGASSTATLHEFKEEWSGLYEEST